MGSMAQWNKGDRSRFVKDYLECGMSLKKYALEKGICHSTFSRWVRQAVDSGASGFVELVEAEGDIKKSGTDCPLHDLEIILPSQVVVKVKSLLPETLVVLVQGLIHAPSRL
jgi:transposase-like protein